MRATLRITALAATSVAIAIAACGCGGADATRALAPLAPPSTLKVAAWDALTLRGIALDSCSAWRLVSISATRNDAASYAHYFGVAQQLAARYVVVHGRYDTHRHALPPSMFLPPFDSLVKVEEGTCWV
jgi:hypothetical protein